MDRTSVWCLDYVHGGKIMPYHTKPKKGGKKKRKNGKKKRKGMRHHGC